MKQLLTTSRIRTFRKCPYKHFIRYECGVSPRKTAEYFRLGGAFHLGKELLSKGECMADVQRRIADNYANPPEWIQQTEAELKKWYYEAIMAQVLIEEHHRYWQNHETSHLPVVAPEMEFRIPIINPATGAVTPVFDFGGKMDQLVRETERTIVHEYKTTSMPIDQDADYWQRLRIDSQCSGYINASRESGHPNTDAVLYDVTRKPAVKPCMVPVTDDQCVKIVLDANGQRVRNKDGSWRQTADTKLGYTLQTREMTLEEWRQKLTEDIHANPERYFQRQMVYRPESDLQDAKQDLWDEQKRIRDCQLNNRWPRNDDACCGFGRCEFFEPCTQRVRFIPISSDEWDSWTPPPGNVKSRNIHPELSEGTTGIKTEGMEELLDECE